MRNTGSRYAWAKIQIASDAHDVRAPTGMAVNDKPRESIRFLRWRRYC